jgi:YVTN family beta-propeller protein
MAVFAIIDEKLYRFFQTAELDKFTSYLPTFESILGSIRISEKLLENVATDSGLQLKGSPVDIAVNPVTNKLYIAIKEAKEIQVIDGSTHQLIQNIAVGAEPSSLALNPYTNKIYVASQETDIVYVIDGLTNTVTAKIQAGPMLGDVEVDTTEFANLRPLVFVTNQGNSSVSIIDDIKGKVISNIRTEPFPFGVGVDSIKNRAYITTNYGVDVIDYSTSLEDGSVFATRYGIISSDYIPTSIALNSDKSRAYITNSDADTVSVIDTASNNLIYEINVGLFPSSIVFNPDDKKLYVSNTGNNLVSVIDTRIEKEMVNSTVREIPTDSIPDYVAFNPTTKLMYVANIQSKTLFIKDSTSGHEIIPLMFHINPPDAGRIECYENGNMKVILESSYQMLTINTLCQAVANDGFVFSSWSLEAPSYNSTYNSTGGISNVIGSILGSSTNSTEVVREVSDDGTYTANFFSLPSFLYNTVSFYLPPAIQGTSAYISIGGLLFIILLAAVKPSIHIGKNANKGKEENTDRNIQDISSSRGPISQNLEKAEKEKYKDEGQRDKESLLLSKVDIVTIDATVLVGVLIFLTVTEGFDPSEQYQINVITASIVFPFALSAIIGVTRREKLATRLMIAGFLNLMISTILIAVMKL